MRMPVPTKACNILDVRIVALYETTSVFSHRGIAGTQKRDRVSEGGAGYDISQQTALGCVNLVFNAARPCALALFAKLCLC